MTALHEPQLTATRPVTVVAQPAPAGRWRPAALELGRQFGLIMLAALLYFGVRGVTEGSVADAVRHSLDVLALEARLGLDIEHWAQGLIIDHQWFVDAANSFYIWGHWPVIAATLIWLHQTRRLDYLRLRNAMFISGAIGLVIFATYAVAPPRLAGIGLVDTVTNHSNAYRVLQPPALVNKYAAIPSLHVGWNFLIGVALYTTTRNRAVRAFSVVSPILMVIAVVVTANHYVLDAVIGVVVAYAGLWASVRLTPRLVELDHRLRTRWHQRHRPGPEPRQALEAVPSPRPSRSPNAAVEQHHATPGSGPARRVDDELLERLRSANPVDVVTIGPRADFRPTSKRSSRPSQSPRWRVDKGRN